MKAKCCASTLLGLVVALGDDAGAQQPPYITLETAKLQPADAAIHDSFGVAVALDGDTLVVGAYGHDLPAGQDCGAAYVYRHDGAGWAFEAKLVPADLQPGDRLGLSVALSGDTALVGAYRSGNDRGAAYVFTRSGSTWSEQFKLTASDGIEGDHFGYKVEIVGDIALVGAPFRDLGMANRAGRIYCFERIGVLWLDRDPIQNPTPGSSDLFGEEMDVDGGSLVVGVSRKNTQAGVAHLFRWSGTAWDFEQTIEGPDATPGFLFGGSVSISGDRALIGAWQAQEHGAAYTFMRTGTNWTFEDLILATDPVPGENIGLTVCLDGDRSLISGRHLELDGSSYFIEVHQLAAGTWNLETTAVASDAQSGNNYHNLDAQGSRFCVGAPEQALPQGAGTGAVYVYDITPTGTWLDLGFALPGASGSPSLDASGYLIPDSVFSLELAGARPFSTAPLIAGFTALNSAFAGGLLVPYPDIIFPLFTDGLGSDEFHVLWPPGIPPGFSFYVQWWVSDPTGPMGYAASNALMVSAP